MAHEDQALVTQLGEAVNRLIEDNKRLFGLLQDVYDAVYYHTVDSIEFITAMDNIKKEIES